MYTEILFCVNALKTFFVYSDNEKNLTGREREGARLSGASANIGEFKTLTVMSDRYAVFTKKKKNQKKKNII